jgi:hypothetical protein
MIEVILVDLACRDQKRYAVFLNGFRRHGGEIRGRGAAGPEELGKR